MNNEAFEALGDARPPTLREGSLEPDAALRLRPLGSGTVTARLKTAAAILAQLRCGHELIGEERELGLMKIGKEFVRPLGDEVLAVGPAGALELLNKRLHERAALRRALERQPTKNLRRIYEYDGERWSAHGQLVAVRIGICITADATLAPYARGVLDGIAVRPATLRVDLLSVATAVWDWATYRCPALAVALVAVRRETSGPSTMGFGTFRDLYQRVLKLHVGRQLSEDDLARGAELLDAITLEGIAWAHVPGLNANGRIYAPAVQALREQFPQLQLDDDDHDAVELFEKHAAQLVYEGLTGVRPRTEVELRLDALLKVLAERRKPDE